MGGREGGKGGVKQTGGGFELRLSIKPLFFAVDDLALFVEKEDPLPLFFSSTTLHLFCAPI